MNIFTYPEIAIAIGQFFPSDPGSQGAILSDPVLGKLRADALSHGWEKAIAGGEEEFSLRSIRNKKGNFRLIGILAKSAEGEWKFCLGVQRETDKPGSGRWQGISPATARKVLDRVEAVAVASELGFDPSSNFVTVNDRGEVGFTAGKPNEIETLAFRAVRAGYRITTGLKKASGFNRARINGIIAGGKAERMDDVLGGERSMSKFLRRDGTPTTVDDQSRELWYAANERCGYWTDDWSKLSTHHRGIPCCPECGCVGMEGSAEEWFASAREFEKDDHPRYQEYLDSSKEKCLRRRGLSFMEEYRKFSKGG